MSSVLSMALGPMTIGMRADQAAALAETAVQGGPQSLPFMQAASFFQTRFGWIANMPPSQWATSIDGAGNPVLSATSGPATVRLQTSPSTSAGTGAPAAFTWDGQSYNLASTLTMTLSYPEQPDWVIQVPLGLVESALSIPLASIAWSQVLAPVLRALVRGVAQCIGRIAGLAVDADLGDAIAGATEVISTEGEIVAGAELSLLAGPAALAGLAVLVALSLVLNGLFHDTYQNIAIVNLTPYDLNWTLSMQEGVASAVPAVAAGSSVPNTRVPAISTLALPGLAPFRVAHQAWFGFSSASSDKGLGIVFQFTLADRDSGAQVAQGAFAFDVPFSGNNSLVASWGPPGDLADYYSNMEGENEQLSLTAVTSVPAGNASITVTYDALDGEQTMPNGQRGYLYNSLAVVRVV